MRVLRTLIILFAILITATTAQKASSSKGKNKQKVCSPSAPVGRAGEFIERTISTYARDKNLSAVLYRVIQRGTVLASGAHGNSQYGVPASTGMYFRNGNVAYTYLGTLLLIFEDKKLLNLTDTVKKWLPANLTLPIAYENITVEQVAYETAGIPDYAYMDAFNNLLYADVFAPFGKQQLIDISTSHPPLFTPPGTGWGYSHANFLILAEILVKAGGKPLDQLLQKHILDPLGLVDTKTLSGSDMPTPYIHTYSNERPPNNLLEESTFWHPSWFVVAMASTICDVAAGAKSIATGTLLSAKSKLKFLDPSKVIFPIPSTCLLKSCIFWNTTNYYGIGILAANGWVTATPSFSGTSTVAGYLKNEDLTVTIFTVCGLNSNCLDQHAIRLWTSLARELSPNNVPGILHDA